VTDHMLAVWGMLGVGRMKGERAAVGTVAREGPGDCSPARRRTRAGVGSGDLWRCLVRLFYRPAGVREGRNYRIVEHLFFWPVLCEKRDIVSFRPLV
jgi:hypothetical protein